VEAAASSRKASKETGAVLRYYEIGPCVCSSL
jgi:hypothetical protein